ncbi:MAG: hypothetical protein CME64_08100 [Halobacteriovoraceae bacterium]|nr:hypothetical protein [Halobacteriovoraceae bacterium]|tara:strand:- start:171119 stop:171472 length:354 start_codon:yes stop_codon:yes gene_type:complete
MLKSLICCALAFTFFLDPKIGMAATGETPQMISSFDAMNMEDRPSKEEAMKDFVSKDKIKEMLEKQGLDPATVNERIAGLSDKELNHLASSVQQQQAGALLVEIVLILLIIYLAQRI